MALLEDGRVLVVGGKIATYLDTSELYDPAADVWSDGGTLSAKRRG